MAFSFKKFWQGLNIVGKATSTSDTLGDMETLTTTNKTYLHDGNTNSALVTETHSAVLSNKTIDADVNIISNLEVDNLKVGVLNTSSTLAGATNDQIPSALASKTYIETKQNTITGAASTITSSNLTTNRALLSNGSGKVAVSAVTSTELGHLVGVTSAIQTQINSKSSTTDLSNHASSTSTHGVSGNIVGTSDAQTISNKNLVDTTTSIVDATDATKKIAFNAGGTASTTTTITAAQTANRTVTLPNATTTLVGTTDTATLTNKTIVVANNTITTAASGNLTSTNLNAALAELQGDIDTINTELPEFVKGPATSVDNTIPRFNLTTGKLLQGSGVVVSDTNVMTGLTGITSSGTVTLSGAVNYSSNQTNSQTGNNVIITGVTANIIRLDGAGLNSIAGYNLATAGRETTFINNSTTPVTILNDSAAATTATNRIITGTGSDIVLNPGASIRMIYNGTTQRHHIIGGVGGGGQSLDTVFQIVGSDISSWSTGDNANFMGGGTLAGTFATNSSTPLNNPYSYIYTQNASSLDSYLASPAQAISRRFRGQTCTLYFPYSYNGTDNKIEVVFYDATAGAVIPSSTFLSGTNGGVSTFTSNVTIPITCESIRVGFHVKGVESGKILEFDDIQLVSNLFSVTNLDTNAGKISEIIFSSQTVAPTNFLPTNNISIGADTSAAGYKGGLYQALYNVLWAQPGLSTTAGHPYRISSTKGASATADWAANKTITIDYQTNSPFIRNAGSGTSLGGYQADDNKAHNHFFYGALVGGSIPAGGPGIVTNTDNGITTTTAYTRKDLSPTMDLSGGAEARPKNVALNAFIRYSEGVPHILTPTETFSTDTAPLTYAGSSQYTLSTLANAPVGTFITFTYATNTNTRTQTNAAPPSQSTSDMNVNGIQIFTRAYNAASTAASPVAIAIQIGKGLKGTSLGLYKSVGKVTAGSVDFTQMSSTLMEGARYKEYNETTGILVVDAGVNPVTTTTAANFSFIDATVQTNGYLTINASKNPALTGMNVETVAVRAVNSSGQSIPTGVNTFVTNWTTEKDSHNAFNTSTGVYTIPSSGWYRISSRVLLGGASAALGGRALSFLEIDSSGSTDIILDIRPTLGPSGYNNFSIVGAVEKYFTKGQIIRLGLSQDTTISQLMSTGVSQNYISIVRTGN